MAPDDTELKRTDHESMRSQTNLHFHPLLRGEQVRLSLEEGGGVAKVRGEPWVAYRVLLEDGSNRAIPLSPSLTRCSPFGCRRWCSITRLP